MKGNEEIIKTFANAILSIDVELTVDHNTPEAEYVSICPFCRETTKGFLPIQAITHEIGCAYLLAKEIIND